MTSQQAADIDLATWQANKHLPAEQRLGCIGNMTHGIRDNATDLFEIWIEQPHRHHEFGAPEREDIREAVKLLCNLLLEIDGVRAIAAE